MRKENESIAEWNDRMVEKYHSKGTLFESKNILLRNLEKMRLRKILRFANIKPRDRVLDLGCGEGHLLLMMKRAAKMNGMDISKVALKRTAEVLRKKPYITIKQGDAENTGLKDKEFTKIVCSEMLEHVQKPRKVMEEIHRILDNNGLLVISVPDERRIKMIMRIARAFGIDRLLRAPRKGEEYEWHIHEADVKFVKAISKGLFRIKRIERTPVFIGYRLVASLKKI